MCLAISISFTEAFWPISPSSPVSDASYVLLQSSWPHSPQSLWSLFIPATGPWPTPRGHSLTRHASLPFPLFPGTVLHYKPPEESVLRTSFLYAFGLYTNGFSYVSNCHLIWCVLSWLATDNEDLNLKIRRRIGLYYRECINF